MKAHELPTAVDVTRVDLICPRCEIGDAKVVMKATGQSRMTHPATHQHVCPWCDYSEFTKDIYPRMDTAPKKERSEFMGHFLRYLITAISTLFFAWYFFHH